MSVKFGKFRCAEDLSQQRELFADAFPENYGTPVTSIDHYMWKFHGPPSSYEYSAIENDQMLGYYAAIPYPYKIGDRRMTVGMVCDVMTHSRARGRGIFTQLGEFSLKDMEALDLDFVTGYPIRPDVMGGHLRVGWQIAFELPMYLKPLKANAILTSRRIGWIAPVANVALSVYQLFLAPRLKAESHQVRVGSPSELLHSTAFRSFLERWSTSVTNHLVKSGEFYDWRLGAPGTEYLAFLVYREDVVVAAAVGRPCDLHDVPSFALLDLMVLQGDEKALRALYSEINRHARQQNLEAIVTMMSKYQAREYRLVRYGFLKSPFAFKLIVRSLKDELDAGQLLKERDWHLMWIDSDDL